jgi:hypothetical protein
MGSDMKIFSAGTTITILSDEFEGYIRETAEHVKGDTVLAAMSRINYARREAEKLYALSKEAQIAPIVPNVPN